MTVFYDHRPGPGSADGRISYQTADDNADRRRNGRPPQLEIKSGGQACVVVVNSNAVLYDYSLTSESLSPTTPADLSMIAAALYNLAVGARTDPNVLETGGPPRNATLYYKIVAVLVTDLRGMQAAKLASDASMPFAVAAGRIDSLYQDARKFDSIADTVYRALVDTDRSQPGVLVAQAEQEEAWKRITIIWKQFSDAVAKGADPLCVTVQDEALQVVLTVKPAVDTGNGFSALRPTGDSVLSFSVNPVSSTSFQVAVGGLVSTLVSDQSVFSIENGVVAQRRDKSPVFQTSVFALGRVWHSHWLWGSIGASVNESGVSALFFGLSGQFGVSLVGPQMTLSVGLSLARVPVGLTQGSVGAALPANVTDVNEIVDKQLRPGLGIGFTLTGLDLGSSQSKK